MGMGAAVLSKSGRNANKAMKISTTGVHIKHYLAGFAYIANTTSGPNACMATPTYRQDVTLLKSGRVHTKYSVHCTISL